MQLKGEADEYGDHFVISLSFHGLIRESHY
jgi:hypothetical protein